MKAHTHGLPSSLTFAAQGVRLAQCLDLPLWAVDLGPARERPLSPEAPPLRLAGVTLSVSSQELTIWAACSQVRLGCSMPFASCVWRPDVRREARAAASACFSVLQRASACFSVLQRASACACGRATPDPQLLLSTRPGTDSDANVTLWAQCRSLGLSTFAAQSLSDHALLIVSLRVRPACLGLSGLSACSLFGGPH